MNIITIGIDLAKNIFAVHGVNESGKAELVKPKVPRDQLLPRSLRITAGLMKQLAIPLSTIKPCKWLVMPALM